MFSPKDSDNYNKNEMAVSIDNNIINNNNNNNKVIITIVDRFAPNIIWDKPPDMQYGV